MNKHKILIFGITGMLGHTIYRYFSEKSDYILYGTVRDNKKVENSFLKAFSKNIISDIDADDFNKIENLFNILRPNLVINCIGIIKQLKEANDPIASITINSLFPHKLAMLSKKYDTRMIHISTDCVFDGSKGNYKEEDDSSAKDLYGKTKFLGEVSYSHTLTLRTSIIGHELNSNISLVDWFLAQHEKVKGFTNAIFSGFPSIEIARIISEYVIPDEKLSGLYQISAESISKYELLKMISKIYKKQIEIEPFNDYYCDRSLNSEKFKKRTGYKSPNWEELIKVMYDDYITYYSK